MKNRIYFYSGTGNSLKAAKDIAAALKDCDIVAITSHTNHIIPDNLERVGFVYPVYYQGLPQIAADFIQNAHFPEQRETYIFAVATHGFLSGNSLPQLSALLNKKNLHLNYARNLKMFSNYVVVTDMNPMVDKITAASSKAAVPIIENIIGKKNSKILLFNPILHLYYRLQIKIAVNRDCNFKISRSCISCGICEKVCAAGNIKMQDGKPEFLHHCNQCLACLQYCPGKAINYKNLTQNRRRYHHPEITSSELAQYYSH